MTDEELLKRYTDAWVSSFTAANPFHTARCREEDLVHIRAGLNEATAPLLERIAQKQARIDQLIQEVAEGADVEAAQRERIAALEAKLAQRVPDGWATVPVKPTEAMVVQGAGIIDDNGGNARWSDMREAWDAMLSAAPAAPEQQEPDCPRCGNNRQVWTNQISGEKTCHRVDCHMVVAQAPNAQQAEPEQQEPTKRCPNCDDTGDVHSIDGEWRGVCHCPAGQAINAQVKPSTNSIVQAAVIRALDEANVRNDVLRGMCIEVALEKARDMLEGSK